MLQLGLNPRTRHSLWMAIGLLCCALIVLTGLVQLAHVHADGQASQADCALCHTAHVVVQPAVPQVLPRAVRVVAAIRPTLRAWHSQRLPFFSLYTRPPPVDIAAA